jgi:hypothetical protein
MRLGAAVMHDISDSQGQQLGDAKSCLDTAQGRVPGTHSCSEALNDLL